MFTMPKLKYTYSQLEPYLDELTVETHFTKHHQNYCNNLNKTLENYPELLGATIEQLLTDTSALPADILQAVVNNGGGYYNHNMYWDNLTPSSAALENGVLLDGLSKTFGSFTDFQKLFTASAVKLFGSGWVWLVQTPTKELQIITTANQNSPLSLGLTPLLALDLWEHAYYLKYQNRRADYITNWWEFVDWKTATNRLTAPLL